MTDPAPSYQPASPAPTSQYADSPPVADTTAAVVLTEAEVAEVEESYLKLQPEAVLAARTYVLAHTPPRLQDAMKAKVDADFPEPVPVEAPPPEVPADAPAS